MAEKDLRPVVGHGLAQTERDVQWEKTIDFSKAPLALNDIGLFMTVPAGFVLTRADAILLTAEGSAATVSIGTKAVADHYINAGDVNGTPKSMIAAGTVTAAAGELTAANTDLYVKALAAVDKAKIRFVLRGYVTDLG